MKKSILLLLLTGMAGVFLHAQTLRVQEQATHRPMAGVSIQQGGTDAGTVTDARGQADISALRGADSIFFRSIGYRTATFSYAQLEQLGFQVLLEEDRISLDAVVVSATRWRQSRRDAPLRISTIRPQEVMLQNPQTAADLLGLSGEVFIQKSQLGGGSPMIRGFSTNRVLITVDGVRMNSAIFRSGNVQNVISLDPFAVDNTEVVFGPGSIIYGSDAIGGVMNFFTLTPALSPGAKPIVKGAAALRYASASTEKTGHFDFSAGWEKWALLSSVTYSDYGDLTMGSRGPDAFLRPTYVQRINGRDSVLVNPNPRRQVPSGYNQLNLMQKLRFAPSEAWDIQYGFHYSETSNYSRYDRLLRPRGNTLRSAEWDYGPQIWMMNNLSITRAAESGAFDQVVLRAAHQFFEESRIERNLNSPTRMIRTEKVNALSANLDFEKQWAGSKNRLFYGAEYVFNQVESIGEDLNIETDISVPAASRYPDGSDWTSAALYLTWRTKVGEQLTLQTGARYNFTGLNAEFDDTFFSFPFRETALRSGALNGSIGAVYSPGPLWQISFNASTGFRSPNIDDIGKVFDSSPGQVVVPNADLRPEYAYNFDLGIAKTFGSVLKVDVTGFYTYLDNALVRRNFSLNGQDSILYGGDLSQVQAIQNAAFATVWGIQAGLEIKLPAGFGISSRYNFQLGEEELDDGSKAPLRHAAPQFGVSRLTYERQRLRAEFYAVYNAAVLNADLAPEELGKEYLYARDADGNLYTPAWLTLNLKAAYRIGENLNLGAGLENITDRRYRPYSSGITAPGRNLVLSLRAAF
jgi:hemoglobin/transferrin/lactoferrin receptor protein